MRSSAEGVRSCFYFFQKDREYSGCKGATFGTVNKKKRISFSTIEIFFGDVVRASLVCPYFRNFGAQVRYSILVCSTGSIPFYFGRKEVDRENSGCKGTTFGSVNKKQWSLFFYPQKVAPLHPSNLGMYRRNLSIVSNLCVARRHVERACFWHLQCIFFSGTR